MLAIGLMSGTSLDGIDAALIESDGVTVAARLGGVTTPYDMPFRDCLRACLGARERSAEIRIVEMELTERHAEAVTLLLKELSVSQDAIDLIGFHGHTITHDPARKFTWQLGAGSDLAKRVGIDVVADFRSADVASGGEGAPLAPAYHAALARGLGRSFAVLNLGGVANVTWVGEGDQLLAFDTGPANALIDDWVAERTGKDFDKDGEIAATGQVDAAGLASLLENEFFSRPSPKSLDRNEFNIAALQGLSLEDGAATLSAFTVESVVLALGQFPNPPTRMVVTGGGRHNAYVMELLAEAVPMPVEPVEAVGWNGDLLEAEAFGYLAIRSVLGLPFSWPATTGVKTPLSGGQFFSKATRD